MRNPLMVLLFIVAGCATPKDVKGPDGTPHKLLTCDEIEDCYEEASQICGKYKIVNTSQHANAVTNGHGGGSYSKMLVKCEG